MKSIFSTIFLEPATFIYFGEIMGLLTVVKPGLGLIIIPD